MNGHFHIELENGVTINESELSVALAKAKARNSQIAIVGFVCTYGCGLLHELTDEEKELVEEALSEQPKKTL